MPIPSPRNKETKENFISRCMSDDVMTSEYPKEDQRAAICQTAWGKKMKKNKKQSDTISLMGDFKYFVQIEKAFEEKGDWFVQGIASGTLEDADDGKMNKSALERFVEGLPLPLTDNHNKGEVLAELGEVVEAKLLEDDSLFIKAKLDKENPSVPYLVKKVSEGKKYAFSIEGLLKKAKTTYSERIGKFVTEYLDIIPEAISITTRPAYQASFLEVITKSFEKAQKDKISQEQKMNKQVEKEEEVKQEEIKQVEIETVDKTDDIVENQEATETEAEEKSEAEEEKKDDTVQVPLEVIPEEKPKQVEEVKETPEAAKEKPSESQEDRIELLNQKIESLTGLVSKLTGGVEEVIEQPKPLSTIEEALQVIQKQNQVMKSLTDRIDNLEKLPLQKKTRATLPEVEKNENEHKEPTSIKEVAEKIV